MQRRAFLLRGSRAAFATALLTRFTQAQHVPASKEAGAWRALIADLENEIPAAMKESAVPGLSIAIIRDAKIQWRRGFGFKDAESKNPIDPETMFEAASMSKPVFAYRVMKLCERGVMDLDTPLTKYTPEQFLKGDPRLERITARHVLSHTSGFQDWRSSKVPLKIHFTPGEKWLYSGEGYSYLQSVVTRLTGHVDASQCSQYEAGVRFCATDFDEYMRVHVLTPFAMTSSGYVWNDRFEKLMARPHDHQGRPMNMRKSKAADVARYGSSGALLTTPTDYARFLLEVIDPKPTDAFRLSKASLDEMLRPQVTVTVTDEYTIVWGLGWRIARTKHGDVIGHGGDNVGFHSLSEASVIRKSGYVIMTNGDGGPALLKRLAPDLSRRLYSL